MRKIVRSQTENIANTIKAATVAAVQDFFKNPTMSLNTTTITEQLPPQEPRERAFSYNDRETELATERGPPMPITLTE